jgi:hypothetical protein
VLFVVGAGVLVLRRSAVQSDDEVDLAHLQG